MQGFGAAKMANCETGYPRRDPQLNEIMSRGRKVEETKSGKMTGEQEKKGCKIWESANFDSVTTTTANKDV